MMGRLLADTGITKCQSSPRGKKNLREGHAGSIMQYTIFEKKKKILEYLNQASSNQGDDAEWENASNFSKY